MNTRSKSLLFVLLLVVGAIGVSVLLNGGDARPPLFSDNEPVVVEEPDNGKAEPPTPLVTEKPDSVDITQSARTEILEGGSGSSYAQGAYGRVVGPDGTPLANTEVFLMEGAGMNMIQQMMLANKGTLIPPAARTETDASGNFELGVAHPDPKKRYEIRVKSNQFVDGHRPNIHIAADEWYDAGRIQLDRGALLYGTVTIEGSGGLPVPDATVHVKPLNYTPTASPTPGREEGVVVEVDPTGSFRMLNAPTGVVTISAVAPGFAKKEKQNITVENTGDNQILFELPPGVAIAGIVTDEAGTPIPNAKVQVTAISSKTPVHIVTRSNKNGQFNAIGLVQGTYMLAAAAPGYVPPKPVKPIQAGDEDVHIVMNKQGSAELRVFDKNNRLMTRYQVTVKRYFKAQDQIATAMIPAKHARTGKDGIFTMEGLNPDSYVFQVIAKGHAKAFTEPFQVVAGTAPPRVELRLNEGGTIEGAVVDSRGQPLPGVAVSTLPNHLDDNPFTDMFGGMIPYKVTRATTKTNAKGVYRFNLLNTGTYQLKFSHSEHYNVHTKGHEVVSGQRTTVEPMVMQRGTVVSGVVRVDGKPSGQVKVTITAVHDPGVTNPSLFNSNAITGNDGSFVMDKRVPPGRYQVMAARQTVANPLLQIADFHKTKQEISLGQGQPTYSLMINIASQ